MKRCRNKPQRLPLFCAAIAIAAVLFELCTTSARAADPADHAFPALGASAESKVEVAWNRFYDHAGLEAILKDIHKAYPRLTKMYSIGESVEGRELWCLEVTARKVGDPGRKPAIYIDGNIHGNEVQGAEAVAYTAWYLTAQYGRLDKITDLLDHTVFYLVPTINPDGRDHWFHNTHSPHSSRTGSHPTDNDRDGLIDEDPYDDLDGNGTITQMRIADPNGRWKPDPDYPEYLMVRAEADEPGQYSMLGWEGIDNDGDGRINEDHLGGYDTNRNWGWDWQPNYIQYGAKDYPFQLPESRAVADFVIAHPNIAAAQSYHNYGGMILHGPGRKGGLVQPEDDKVYNFIADRGEKMLPFYRNLVVWKDLYTVWGGEFDWFYGARGITALTNELWTLKNLYRTDEQPDQDERAAFIKYVLMDDGIVPWTPYEHPTYGAIEIGGMAHNWSRVPPSFLLEEECHRNMAFTLYHADMMPRLSIADIEVTALDGDGDLHRVWVTVENSRLIPTRLRQDVLNHISPPDVVTIRGKNIEVLSSGRVLDRFFKRVEPTERRHERVEIETIPGMTASRVQFIIAGTGDFTVTVDSAKGGLHERGSTLNN